LPARHCTNGPWSGGDVSWPIDVRTQQEHVDRLSKLADLRDRRVRTDAEFETQKKRLLGE
jgi:hypothetical protein